MAKARFVTEVAPPPVVTVTRRRKVPRSLDTITEDRREQLAYGPASDHQGFAPARTRRAAPAQARERADRLMRELSRHFSDAYGQQAGAGGWESGHRRVVRVQELHENRA